MISGYDLFTLLTFVDQFDLPLSLLCVEFFLGLYSVRFCQSFDSDSESKAYTPVSGNIYFIPPRFTLFHLTSTQRTA